MTLSVEYTGSTSECLTLQLVMFQNYFLLAAALAIYLIFLLLQNQGSRAEGRGRVARRQRRLIIVEVEKRIMQYQIYVDQGLVRNWIYFFVVFFLPQQLYVNIFYDKNDYQPELIYLFVWKPVLKHLLHKGKKKNTKSFSLLYHSIICWSLPCVLMCKL